MLCNDFRSFVCLFICAVFVRVWPEQWKAMALFEGLGLRKMTMLYLLSHSVIYKLCKVKGLGSRFFWSFPHVPL